MISLVRKRTVIDVSIFTVLQNYRVDIPSAVHFITFKSDFYQFLMS